ncbi:MAG: hypothetical protein AAGE52_16805 [Myxococcota bacterium]
MSTLDTSDIQEALEEAGLEVYRSRPDEIQVAERVRLHIMDSGVRVVLQEALIAVQFTARSQRSDFPSAKAEDLFDRVRGSIGQRASDRGYQETGIRVHEVTDPVDDAKVLDVWHEVIYQKPTEAMSDIVEEVRWALDVEKYVTE